MTRGTLLARLTGWMGGTLLLLGFIAGVVVLMLWLGGTFSPKVAATATAGQSRQSASPGGTVRGAVQGRPVLRIGHGDDPCRA